MHGIVGDHHFRRGAHLDICLHRLDRLTEDFPALRGEFVFHLDLELRLVVGGLRRLIGDRLHGQSGGRFRFIRRTRHGGVPHILRDLLALHVLCLVHRSAARERKEHTARKRNRTDCKNCLFHTTLLFRNVFRDSIIPYFPETVKRLRKICNG